MNLIPNYSKRTDIDYDEKHIMLVLDFNNVTENESRNIIDKVISFAKTNLYCENCYFVSFDSRGRMRFPRKMDVPVFKHNVDSYSIDGMILPDKKLRKEIMEKTFGSRTGDYSEEKFLEYLKNDEAKCNTNRRPEDFEISFSRTDCGDKFSFECVISVSCYSLNYDYGEITKYYNELIMHFCKNYNLFAAYIDFAVFMYDAMVYEYCYNIQLQEDTYESLRSFCWGGYIAKAFLDSHPGALEKISKSLNCDMISDGLLYRCNCKLEDYNLEQQRYVYSVFKEFLPKGYDLVPFEILMTSGVKPFEDTIHLFDCFGNKCVVFSNGISLEEIKNDEENMFCCRYLKTIDL